MGTLLASLDLAELLLLIILGVALEASMAILTGHWFTFDCLFQNFGLLALTELIVDLS